MNHQNHHRPTTKRTGGGRDPTTVLQPGQVNFRLLCHVNNAGGVIGNSGNVIKNLETQTGCKIRFEDPLPNCHERVINITGDSNIDKKIRINYNNSEVVEVSRAQEGLIRVYERVSEVEGNDGGVLGCRLLGIKGQIGALMGKGGTIVDGIRKSTGAKIKVLKKEQRPSCALPEEELIQIMGGIVAVKKALVPVSRRLQIRLPAERKTAHVTSNGSFYEQPADFPLDTKSSPRNAINHSSVAHSLSSDVDRVLNLDADSGQKKVVFRLLCSYVSAGGVIGRGANIVKALENDTGASIKFSTPIARSKERVATISSLENRDPLYSPAQVATIRVFERSVEVSREHGHIKGGSISARILVGLHEIKCLLDERGRVSSDIGSSTGVEVQLLGAEDPNCVEDDKVVQIVGEHDNVKSAIFQLTGRLRETFFSSLVSEGAVPQNFSSSSHSHSSQHKIGTSMPSPMDQLSSFSSLDQMDHLGFGPNFGGPHTLLQDKQSKDRMNSKAGKAVKQSMGGLKSSHGGRKSGRTDKNGAAKKTVVITVSQQKFGAVYGENGSNLARLKEISGAAVILQDPGPGECDGKVIISGAPEQLQIAQSLLHAFILL
ncbi:hypothetical protein RND71_014911 [Anisodus tanguticus]|uniref:K Homology domain-containing protein n=1 Tax=Anisodus tanguticus TaxID=243964 RepID=A0AAE1VKA7_9SOLA|nr:hypothetical protein RND71_014911 [Anisodus tanguticus]